MPSYTSVRKSTHGYVMLLVWLVVSVVCRVMPCHASVHKPTYNDTVRLLPIHFVANIGVAVIEASFSSRYTSSHLLETGRL